MTGVHRDEEAATTPVAQGDEGWPAALLELYRTQFAALVRLAYLLTSADSAAEELVQDAFLAVRTRVATMENPGAYLRAAVVNRCANLRRHRDVEQRYLRRQAPREVVGEPEILADALRALPARQRAVIVLRYYEGLSEIEIADLLGCRRGTVKSAAARGLAALRKVIDR